MKAFCLFEQSGTFKNEFKKLGIEAYDYDILNEYGQTDYIIDLFEEIRGGYDGKSSIFDDFTPEDIVLAFFPCTYFECQNSINFRGEANQMKKWSDIQKLEYDLKQHKGLSKNYEAITKLALICLRRNLRLIIENPLNLPHYLSSYWAIKPKIRDLNRRENGDYLAKPTQYWFINCEPKQNLVFEAIEWVEPKTIGNMSKKQRSEIHPQYASRFIRQYILD